MDTYDEAVWPWVPPPVRRWQRKFMGELLHSPIASFADLKDVQWIGGPCSTSLLSPVSLQSPAVGLSQTALPHSCHSLSLPYIADETGA